MGIADKKTRVLEILRSLPGAVVGYSGGVDSTLLAVLARRELGDRAVAAIARSESLAAAALSEAERTAAAIGLPLLRLETDELRNPAYARNASDRCFFCKEELTGRLWEAARERGLGAVLLGVIADDAGDYRPGIAAARKEGARFPLMEAGLVKEEVRSWARELGLPNWARPAEACLSSRIAYGETVTREKLSRVERAEEAVRRAAGTARVRVRLHGDVARIETDPADLASVLARRDPIVSELKGLGFLYVTLDLAGYRTGSLNEALQPLRPTAKIDLA